MQASPTRTTLLRAILAAALVSFLFPGGAFSEDQPQVFRGVTHVHSKFSHDSNAQLEFLIEQGANLGLDFILVTDHNSLKGRESYRKMEPPERPLLVFGDEISTSDGHLIALGTPSEPPEGKATSELIDWIHAQGGYAFIPHPFSAKHPWQNWNAGPWDGFEVYNFGHSLYEEDAVSFYLDSFSESAAEILDSIQKIPEDHLAVWDRYLKDRPVPAMAGTDAHFRRNGKQFSVAMQSAIVYVLAPKLGEEEIVRALGQGKTFMAFESRGQAAGFSFSAAAGGETFSLGETLHAPGPVSFRVSLPAPGKIRLIQDGAVIAESEGEELRYTSGARGAFRVEVYREEKLWIFSNPIYVR